MKQVRKHFETASRGQINSGRMIKNGNGYTVRYMDENDIPASLGLQGHVLSILKAEGKAHYILEKNDKFFRDMLRKGDALIGTFAAYPDPAKPPRLAAHMMVIYPDTPAEAGVADVSALPASDMRSLSVVSNVLVHNDFRGNRLMQQMLDEWLKIAAADGKKLALAEVCVDNPFSWRVFLDCGFVMFAGAHDHRDGSDVIYVRKPLDREYIYSPDARERTMVKLFDQNDTLDGTAHAQMLALFARGYHALAYDAQSKFMLMAKCVGAIPLAVPTVKTPNPGSP